MKLSFPAVLVEIKHRNHNQCFECEPPEGQESFKIVWFTGLDRMTGLVEGDKGTMVYDSDSPRRLTFVKEIK